MHSPCGVGEKSPSNSIFEMPRQEKWEPLSELVNSFNLIVNLTFFILYKEPLFGKIIQKN